MMSIHAAYYCTEEQAVFIQHNSGLVVVRTQKVKTIPTPSTKLPPKKECPQCQGFGEIGMSGDRCTRCAGIGYIRS